MIFIKSKDNDRYKLAKSLLKGKFRNKEKKYLAEGLRTIELALQYNASIDCVFVNEDFSKEETNKKILESLDRSNTCFILSNDLFDKISSTENTQGIIAVINMSKLSIDDFDREKHKKIIILDRVQDPGNLGTIIRTADAAGFDMIIMTKGCVDVYNPKVVRSAMGSMFYMDIVSSDDEDILKILKENKVEIISSYLNTDNYFNEIKYSDRSVLVVGNEANGISDFWIDNSDILVKIPMIGKAESLNVAISAALLMYQINF